MLSVLKRSLNLLCIHYHHFSDVNCIVLLSLTLVLLYFLCHSFLCDVLVLTCILLSCQLTDVGFVKCIYVYVCTYVCYVCMYACMYARMLCMYVCMYVCIYACVIVLTSTVQYFPIRATANVFYMFANMLPLNMYRYERRVLGKWRKNILKTGIRISV